MLPDSAFCIVGKTRKSPSRPEHPLTPGVDWAGPYRFFQNAEPQWHRITGFTNTEAPLFVSRVRP